MTEALRTFQTQSYLRFPADPAISRWVQSVLPTARAAVDDPAHAQWHVCENTWFVGVDALPNDADGSIAGAAPLAGTAFDFARDTLGFAGPWHRAQLSVTSPGYPKPRAGETRAAFGYRLRRDAAHVDGVRASGPDRSRFVEEPHAFILGIALTCADEQAAPPVVWEGSHEIMSRAFAGAFADHRPGDWHKIDITEIYKSARRDVFDSCRRIELPAQPGEATLLHRLALHGVAPWGAGATSEPPGRMIAYFRPELPGGVPDWVIAP